MTIEVAASCDNSGCKNVLNDGEACYCEVCFSALEKRVEYLETELYELRKELKNIEEQTNE